MSWRCLLVRRRLPLFVGDDLLDRERMSVEAHLEHCALCRARVESLRRSHLPLLASGLGEPPAFRPLWPALRARLESPEVRAPAQSFWLPTAALAVASIAIAVMLWDMSGGFDFANRSTPPAALAKVGSEDESTAEHPQPADHEAGRVFDTRPVDVSFTRDSYFHLEHARPLGVSYGDF